VVDDRAIHSAEHALRHVRRPRDLEEEAAAHRARVYVARVAEPIDTVGGDLESETVPTLNRNRSIP
jgi:hypothetical protein